MYKHLLFDADNTLLDFNAGERCALQGALNSSPLEFSDSVYIRYHNINADLWKELELGKIERSELRELRFERLFNEFGFNGSLYAKQTDELFLLNMRDQAQLFNGVEEVLSQLKERYTLYIVTNASLRVQPYRLKKAGFDKYFKKYYISEELGVNKPQKDFFDKVICDIGESREEYLVIGDSLSSDIKGAASAGLHSCYLDHTGEGPKDQKPEFIIRDIREILNIL